MLQPDGRWLAPWDEAAAGPRPGAVATVTSPSGWAARNGGFGLNVPAGGHPLAEPALSAALKQRAEEIEAAFALIQPVLRRLAPRQFDAGFPEQAHGELVNSLGVDIPATELESSWSTPLDLGRLHARCVLGIFRNLVERGFDRSVAALLDEDESAEVLIQRFGFHAVD
ncbi:MAG: carboxysome shell carbonic anhydrase, partial [Actinomycetota bacterium]|nr:carboxysome shell carbonic anhydrase [Actinomycetota bacterium]